MDRPNIQTFIVLKQKDWAKCVGVGLKGSEKNGILSFIQNEFAVNFMFHKERKIDHF